MIAHGRDYDAPPILVPHAVSYLTAAVTGAAIGPLDGVGLKLLLLLLYPTALERRRRRRRRLG